MFFLYFILSKLFPSTEWPSMRWCAIKKILIHSRLDSSVHTLTLADWSCSCRDAANPPHITSIHAAYQLCVTMGAPSGEAISDNFVIGHVCRHSSGSSRVSSRVNSVQWICSIRSYLLSLDRRILAVNFVVNNRLWRFNSKMNWNY